MAALAEDVDEAELRRLRPPREAEVVAELDMAASTRQLQVRFAMLQDAASKKQPTR